MIRSGAWDRARRSGEGAVEWVQRIPRRLRIARKDREEALALRAVPGVPTTQERLADLLAFYQRYEDLVDVLCAGAQYGPEVRLEGRYEELRRWFQSHYRDLRPFIRPFLVNSDSELENAHEAYGARSDAFEMLFAAPTLGEFLRCDDGEMIQRIERTQDALARYGAHLRALAA